MGVTELPKWLREMEEALENNRSSTLKGTPTIKRLLSPLKAIWAETQGHYEWNASLKRLTGNIQWIIEQGGEGGK